MGWERGHLPFGGGLADQPAWLDQALAVVAGARAEVERARLKRG